jgi:hypothetical protein
MSGRSTGGMIALAIAAAVTGAGCGSTSGKLTPDASAFIGTWKCSGTQVESCPSGSHTDDYLYTATFTAGASESSIVTTTLALTDTTTGGYFPGPGDPVQWLVAGTQATIDGTQTLGTGPGSLGGTWTPTVTLGSMTLVSNTLSGSDAGSALFVDGPTETCGYTQTFECSR